MTTLLWLLIAFGLSLAATLLLTPLVMKGAGAMKLYDAPDGGRRMHGLPVPRLGGVAVYLAAAAVASLLFIRTAPLFITPGEVGDGEIRFLTGVFVGSALLLVVGLIDDIRGLSAGAKFLAQISAAAIAYYFGASIDAISLGYGAGQSLGWLELPLMMLWIVGVTNAVNFIDGLHGLAAGISVVAAVTVMVAGAILGNTFVMLPCVALIGALLGFLHFNFPEGRIFLGDSGSLSIGFLLAVLSVQGAVNTSGALLVVIPLLAMTVPLLDGALAVLRRWLRSVPLSGADARHIHHRLLALGVSPQRTAFILWGLAAAMAAFGLLIALTAPFVAASIAILGLVAVAVLAIYGTNLLSYHELVVAGEVLLSAPSRVRRVISDQILALDLTMLLHEADSIDSISALLARSSEQFGFLRMDLVSEGHAHATDRLVTAHWAWKLDYPIRITEAGAESTYVLSIWCSPEQSTRPYGAERVARILGPAIEYWLDARATGQGDELARMARRQTPIATRRLRLR